MTTENCDIMTKDGQYFDITHTFKVGSSTYHVLGLGKERPTNNNTYYIFNCIKDHNDSMHPSPPRSSRPLTAFERRTWHVQRSHSTRYSRTRYDSTRQVDKDETTLKETITDTMRSERRLLMASFRREMNSKERTLLRTIRKDQEAILQAKQEASIKEHIIRSLEEQNEALKKTLEDSVSTVNASFGALKELVIETLNKHHTEAKSMEEVQNILLKTIEQKLGSVLLKNEEILKSVVMDTDALSRLQTNIVQKIETSSNTRQRNDETVLNRLFTEQRRSLTDIVSQQQHQTIAVDIIKQAVSEVIKEQQKSTVDNNITTMKSPQVSLNASTDGIAKPEASTNGSMSINESAQNLPQIKSNQTSYLQQKPSSKPAAKRLPHEHLLKVSIISPENIRLFAKLLISGIQYPRHLYTLCQRDAIQKDVVNCYISPPCKDGPYDITIFAKTDHEAVYRAAINIRIPGLNFPQPITFPKLHQSFEQHQCVLIEPLYGCLKQNEQTLIHMLVPRAHAVKIRNGTDTVELGVDEYKNEVVKTKIRVRGDVQVLACWDKKHDVVVCIFKMVS